MMANPIKRFLKSSGQSKTDFAAKIGMSIPHFINLSNGKHYDVRAHILADIVRVSKGGIDLHELVAFFCAVRRRKLKSEKLA